MCLSKAIASKMIIASTLRTNSSESDDFGRKVGGKWNAHDVERPGERNESSLCYLIQPRCVLTQVLRKEKTTRPELKPPKVTVVAGGRQRLSEA